MTLLRIMLVAGLWMTASHLSAKAAPPDVRLATFVADVTPPIGEGPCIGLMPTVESIEHPLLMKGIVLKSGAQTYVVAAIDYCGLCNSSDEAIRTAMAEAAGTTADRVALQSLHQHTAPVLDAEGARILYGADSERYKAHLQFTDDVSARAAKAITESLTQLRPVSRIVGTRAKVDRVASNRRVTQADGSVAVRWSFTRDNGVRDAPEGLIDPWVRTLTFFDADSQLVQMHYYATHPQSFYGDGRISWDTVGIARERLEQETGVFQVYFNGCGGNVTLGKYNDGTREGREQLASRLCDGMRLSGQAAEGENPNGDDVHRDTVVDIGSLDAADVAWDAAALGFTPRTDGAFAPEVMRQMLAEDKPLSTRLTAACFLAWTDRLRHGESGRATRLRIGEIDVVHLPGEPFVQLQLYAQEAAGPNRFTCVAGYGECGVWYYGDDQIYSDRGGYEQSWSFTGPCVDTVEAALAELVGR